MYYNKLGSQEFLIVEHANQENEVDCKFARISET